MTSGAKGDNGRTFVHSAEEADGAGLLGGDHQEVVDEPHHHLVLDSKVILEHVPLKVAVEKRAEQSRQDRAL